MSLVFILPFNIFIGLNHYIKIAWNHNVFSSFSKKLANPRGIDDLLLSSTGQYCFPFNKKDECFTQWTVDPMVVEDHQDHTSNSVKDFLSVPPDKKESKLFSDMKDFFCYIQIEKGATALSNRLPIEELLHSSELWYSFLLRRRSMTSQMR